MRDGHAGVRLMNDYGCRWPIWWIEAQQAEVDVLDLSEDLEADVRAWATHFADHFDHLTSWDSDEARRTHARLADSLLERLRAEIGDDLEVHSDLWELDRPRT
jgi:hypothetical protein